MDAKVNSAISTNEFVISHVFDASRERVWRAWTEREQLMRWFGPKGYTMPQAKLDLRPDGIFHYALRSADGQTMWGKWTFREIVAPERLVLVSSFSDELGRITRHPMSTSWPLETLSTTTFEEKNGKTKLTIHWAPLYATNLELKTFDEAHDGMRQGWGGTFEQLAAYLKGDTSDSSDREMAITRTRQSTSPGKAAVTQLNPYLYFEGRCEEAIEFYRTALGAEVTMLMRYKESPEPQPPGMLPPGSSDKVMHMSFRIGDATVFASDGMCSGKLDFRGVSLTLTVANDAEAERLFAALSKDGHVQMPMATTFFSSRFGMVADRFGVPWMVIVTI